MLANFRPHFNLCFPTIFALFKNILKFVVSSRQYGLITK